MQPLIFSLDCFYEHMHSVTHTCMQPVIVCTRVHAHTLYVSIMACIFACLCVYVCMIEREISVVLFFDLSTRLHIYIYT